MKLVGIGSFLSKRFKSKRKKSRGSPPSRQSSATASFDDSPTPKSVLPQHDFLSHSSSDSIAIADLFTLFDQDGDGKITKEELEIVLRRLSPDAPPTDEELASMVAEIDRDGDGCISLEELGAIGHAALGTPAACEELRDAFAVFDADGDGKISAEELLGVFTALGDSGCTLDDCRRMIVGVDSDGDGFVCFADFARMMDGQRSW
ncbi:putative calcium-binding protein CML36 [Apostasia shenzhenica]|uniref:Putative calcium-binding protein CML36 n=1 Tax=Apostasia shenzhenica TaxID=1088818 RepID=A0A2I0ASU3_9ASPA|nr:putative calcium-binding protein CML36 [Apostasia shenzhenica]